MRYILAVCFLTALSSSAMSAELEAKSWGALLARLETDEFRYHETGRLFGFVSTQSCMFKSPALVVFKNYCYPVRTYPAQGYTIISAEFGIIELYEEKMERVLKRDIHISQFPTILAPYLSPHSPDLTLADYSSIMEKMYQKYYPGCWSTNFSYYTESADANCTVARDQVIGFSAWELETQALLTDQVSWQALIKALNTKFQRPTK